MKISFIFPRFKYESGDPPLGVAYLASYIRKFSDSNIEILDTTFDHSFERVKTYFKKNKPDIVGVYLDTIMYNDAIKIIKEAKRYDCFIIAGGPHTTILPETLIDFVDAVIIGEAEKPMLKIIKNFDNKDFGSIKNIWYKKRNIIYRNKITYNNTDLDTYPFPSRDLLNMEKYIERCHQFDSINPKLRATTMVVSRGCPFSCSFCQPTLRKLFGKKFRIRSQENIIAEIKRIKKKYNLNAIFFHDDTLTANKNWVIQFCSKLKKANLDLIFGCNTRIDTVDKNLLEIMYNAGFRELHIGIESASQRIINDIYKKGINISTVKNILNIIRKIGFNTMCFFMIGAPTETKDDIKKTIKFACSLPTNEISVSITNPIPKTELHKIMLKKHYFISNDYIKFDYYSTRGFYRKNKDELGLEELKKLQKLFLLRFYCNPKRWIYILKHVSSKKGIKKMIMKLKRFI